MSEVAGETKLDRLRRLEEFLDDRDGGRLFICPIDHPSRPTGFCPCDKSFIKSLGFYAKATLLKALLALPYNAPKIWCLRRLGAKIGDNVYISVGAFIDPLFPGLLTVEDDVLIGMEARIMLHEFGIDEFRAGRIILRRGCLIGAFSILRPGIEIGESATVASGSVVTRDVPPGTTAIGGPARIVRKQERDT